MSEDWKKAHITHLQKEKERREVQLDQPHLYPWKSDEAMNSRNHLQEKE